MWAVALLYVVSFLVLGLAADRHARKADAQQDEIERRRREWGGMP